MNAYEIFEAKKRKRDFILTAIFVAIMIAIFAALQVRANATPFKGKDIKIAVINRGAGQFIHEYFAGAKQEGESMGITVDTFSANHDLINFHNLLVQVKNRKYNGVIISQFKSEGVLRIDDVKQLIDKKIPVVAFNCDSELSKIKEITMTSQDHAQMAKLTLNNMHKQLNGKGNIIYLGVDDYPELMARSKIYEQFLKANLEIKEIERFGVSAPNPIMETKEAVAAMLEGHGKGKIDAIFTIREAFARGAVEAIKKAGRSEVKIYSMGGVENSDLQSMQEENSPWVSTTGVDKRKMGAINVRLLLKKIAGEKTPVKYNFKPILITQEQLRSTKEKVNIDNLDKVVKGWGDNKEFEEEWMRTLKRKHKQYLAKEY